MRVDGKQEGPRQSMSWLHTWASLILGWLLYAIFVTGTLSFFQNEITVWMKPELHQSVPQATQVQQTQVALNYLQKNHPDATAWNIQLPNSRQNTTLITVRKQGEDPRARRGGTRITIDSATGQTLEARETRGGSFLYRFHFELYGMPRMWSRWIVGIATLLMFVAIISGVITHKKIFKDFFTFRSGKGQRSWLDAHNATAVLALPFHIMITFSGLLLLLFTIMPWGVERVYEGRGEFLQDQNRALVQENKESKPSDAASNRNQPANAERAQGAERGEKRRGRDKKEAQPAELTNVAPILAYAQQEWKNNPIGTISIIAPNTNQAKIELRALHGESVTYRNVYASLQFDGVTGKNITDDSSSLKNPNIPMGIYNVFTTLHEARGVDIALRWLLFLSGIVGTVMVATGLILWCVKRAPQQQKQGYKSFGYRLVEVTNIAAIIGLPIACAAYFYANRFIPADMDMRLNWEIRTFFVVWLLTLIYPIFRSSRQAWLELLALATVLFALLPILNFMTGGQALWNSIAYGQWVIASFDLAMWVLTIVFAFSYYKVKKHPTLPAKKAKKQEISA
ncbi:PepSY-associated TM helix domain-containing protein [Acinetobacter faecalis]|uniref:PepSY-associated TM helix domain-containing protein n=1 Tax=Acinetobacter TaxID=469 RepID=UPI00279BA3B8|nr:MULTISPECIES: PepSY-associated TM helix domain-containing protein [Acinetobacter]MDY6460207.1 PepSY-associated TM helix domain-containing protein [Acinetobacter faecalis]MDY6523348.1 PepSY-associated TM helix domain-containing protein [Acinetobacter faecalis]WFP95990.1 PepSY-associated TM helix domain-containing protein [Acinetobacter sp. ANC 7201]